MRSTEISSNNVCELVISLNNKMLNTSMKSGIPTWQWWLGRQLEGEIMVVVGTFIVEEATQDGSITSSDY